MKFRFIMTFCLAVGLLTVSGCGYTINQPGEMPGNVRSVYVNVFENLTTDVGLETMIASSIVSEISRYNAKSIAATPQQADAIIKGTIRSVSSQSTARHGVNVAAERLAVVMVDVQLVDRNGMVLWQVRNMSGREAYLVFTDKITTDASKYTAYSQIIARLAERIYSQMTDNKF